MVKSISPRTIWGKIVFYLRQNNYVSLHVVCGGLSEIELENNTLIVNVYDSYIADILEEESNFRAIKKALDWQELNLDLQIKRKKKEIEKYYEDIRKLKNLVEEYLIVKGDEKWAVLEAVLVADLVEQIFNN